MFYKVVPDCATELFELGVARRHLKHRQVTWTEDMNTKLVKKIDSNKDGKIEKSEFVAHFSASLPTDREQFEEVIEQFMEVADFVAEREAGKLKQAERRGMASRRGSVAHA